MGTFPARVSARPPAICVLGAYEGQRRVSEPLELKLQVVMGHHGPAENQTFGHLEEQPVLFINQASLAHVNVFTVT